LVWTRTTVFQVLSRKLGSKIHSCPRTWSYLTAAATERFAIHGRSVEHVVYDWNAEHEADWEAFHIGDLALHVSRNREQRTTGVTWGAELFFSACEIIERAFSILEFGEGGHRPSESHPPPDLRRKILRSSLKDLALQAKNWNEITFEHLLAPGVLIEIVCAELWKRVEDCFLKLHQSGHRPAPLWRENVTPLV
jgi:hypothetical protein